MGPRPFVAVASDASLVDRCCEKRGIVARVWAVTVTSSSDDYGMEIFLREVRPIVTAVAEFGRVTHEQGAESRCVGTVTGGAFPLRNGPMDVGLLESRFLMTAITEFGHFPYEFHAAFLQRMCFVRSGNVAGSAAYAKGGMVILRGLLEFGMTTQTRTVRGGKCMKRQGSAR